MPTYEFRCRACGETFTEVRPMAHSGDPATCSAGHDDTVKLLDVAGAIGSLGSGSAPVGSPRAGGCCGGGCCAN